MPRLLFRIPLILICLSVSTTQASIIIDNFSSATNDRFANADTFILDGFDLTGLGRSSDGKWGTLISENVFISSNHSRPSIGASLTFFSSNDPNGGSITRAVSSGQRIGFTDLWVGVLETPVTHSFSSFTYLTADIIDTSAFQSSALNGAIGYMVGLSPTAWASSRHDVAIGTNTLDAWVEDSNAAGTTADALSAIYRLGLNDLTYEALLQSGDSGAPLFVTDGSTLFLAGINWWEGTANLTVDMVASSYQLSGFSYVGNYDAAITSFVTTNAVPEPAAFAGLLGVTSLGFAMLRRRRRSPILSFQ